MNKRWVFFFDEMDVIKQKVGEDFEHVRALLGGKGANLVEMTRIGIPVPWPQAGPAEVSVPLPGAGLSRRSVEARQVRQLLLYRRAERARCSPLRTYLR